MIKIYAVCSYKEDSENGTDEDDVIEWKNDEAETKEPKTEDNAETIEKIINSCVGRKGATGSQTTIYNVQFDDQPDPNANLDPEKEETEKQYLVKWKVG